MSYYEKRIADLEARVAQLAMEQRLKAIPVEAKLFDRIKELKAEVERLTTGIQPEGSNDAVGRAVELLLKKEKEIARLKAEVEHLQSENLLVREEADRYCRLWQEAKEGKQS
jgi:heterodisulfide reductase subunit A-like polyferredoxin